MIQSYIKFSMILVLSFSGVSFAQEENEIQQNKPMTIEELYMVNIEEDNEKNDEEDNEKNDEEDNEFTDEEGVKVHENESNKPRRARLSPGCILYATKKNP